MNDRERFKATMHYQPRDRSPICDFGYWDETLVGIARMPGTGSWHLMEYAILEEQIQTTPGPHTLRVQAVDTDPAQQHDINFDKIGIGFNWSPPLYPLRPY